MANAIRNSRASATRSHRTSRSAAKSVRRPRSGSTGVAATICVRGTRVWRRRSPGTRHGYHAITFGWLVGEVVRRISGKSLGAYFRDEIAKPLGADAHIGIGAENDARIAEMIFAAPPGPGERNIFAEMMKDPTS